MNPEEGEDQWWPWAKSEFKQGEESTPAEEQPGWGEEGNHTRGPPQMGNLGLHTGRQGGGKGGRLMGDWLHPKGWKISKNINNRSQVSHHQRKKVTKTEMEKPRLTSTVLAWNWTRTHSFQYIRIGTEIRLCACVCVCVPELSGDRAGEQRHLREQRAPQRPYFGF